jgi:hypothetical protein
MPCRGKIFVAKGCLEKNAIPIVMSEVVGCWIERQLHGPDSHRDSQRIKCYRLLVASCRWQDEEGCILKPVL